MKRSPFFTLPLVLIFAFLVRFWGFWIASFYIDESTLLFRSYEMLMGREFFNPRFPETMIAYGMIISYLQAFFMKLVYLLGHWQLGWDSIDTVYVSLKISTRFLSVLAGTTAVYFTYLSAKKLFNYKVGLFSALVLAFSFNHVTMSKYAMVDIFVSFFLSAVLYFSAVIFTERKNLLKAYFFGGVFSGLAFALKYNFPVFLPILVAHSLIVWQSLEIYRKKLFLYFLRWWTKEVSIFILVTIITFVVTSPYILINPRDYLWQIQTILTAAWNFPDGSKNLDNIPNTIWYINYMLRVGLYYPFFFFVIGGIFITLKKYKKQALFLLSYPVAQLVLLEFFPTRSDRYVVWWLPMLSVFAGVFLWASFNLLFSFHPQKFFLKFAKQAFMVGIVLLILIPIFRLIMFGFIITVMEDTRKEAGNFISNNPRPIYFLLDVDGKFITNKNLYLLDSHPLRLVSLDPTNPSPYNVFRYPGQYILITEFIYGENLYFIRHNPENKIFNNPADDTKKVLSDYLKEAKLIAELMKGAKFTKEYSRLGFGNGLFDSLRIYGGGTLAGMSYNPVVRVYKIPQLKQALPLISVTYYPQPAAVYRQEVLSIIKGGRIIDDKDSLHGQVILAENQGGTSPVIQASRGPFPSGEYEIKVNLKLSNLVISQKTYGLVTFGDQNIKGNISYQEIKGVNLKNTKGYQMINLPFKLSGISNTAIELTWIDRSPVLIEKIEVVQIK